MIYPNYLAAIQILRMGEQMPRELPGLLAEEKYTEAAAVVRSTLSNGGTPLRMAQLWQLLGMSSSCSVISKRPKPCTRSRWR